MSGGRGVGSGSACGARDRKRRNWKWGIESATALILVSIKSTLKIIFKWKVSSTNFLTNSMTLRDLDDFLFMICTTAWLSMWNNILLLAYKASQTDMANTTGKNSKKVKSPNLPRSDQCWGHLLKAHLSWKMFQNHLLGHQHYQCRAVLSH